MKQIGALWLKEGKKCKFMSGTVNDVGIIIFKNNRKKQKNHPDYIVYESAKKTNQNKESNDFDSDVPF